MSIGWLCLLGIVFGSAFGFPLQGVRICLHLPGISIVYHVSSEYCLSRPCCLGCRSFPFPVLLLGNIKEKKRDSLVRDYDTRSVIFLPSQLGLPSSSGCFFNKPSHFLYSSPALVSQSSIGLQLLLQTSWIKHLLELNSSSMQTRLPRVGSSSIP